MWEACFHIKMFEEKILMMQATEWGELSEYSQRGNGIWWKVKNTENPPLVMGETYLSKCIHSFIPHLIHMLIGI